MTTDLKSAEVEMNFLRAALSNHKGGSVSASSDGSAGQGDEIKKYSLAGDASARRYFRVEKGSETFVLMCWEPFRDEKNYPFLNIQKHFLKHDVHVPKVIAVDKEHGLVLLEDLGDLTLERKFWESQNPEYALSFYKEAIDELIKMHYPATADRESGCVAFDIDFNTQRLLWEMNYAREHLLEKFLQLKFNKLESALLEQQFTHICERLHQEPKFIAHRDYHSRNLMIKSGLMRVIDFQDARLGPVQYDLVSLLRDSYVNLDQEVAHKLINYYLEKRLQFIPEKVNRELFDLTFEIQSIQRCLKACGSFASFYNTRQDTRYLKYLTQTMARVKGSLLLFPEYRDLLTVLSERGVFDRDIAIL
jgi:aminoglycoside/choline kinase family phosphotransferase